MSMDKYMFTSSVIIKVPQLLPYCDRIEKIEFWDESSKLARLVEYMFKNAESTNPHMNRIIVYTLSICIVKAIETKRGFILLFNEGTLSPAFLLNRSILEIWAAAYFVEKKWRAFAALGTLFSLPILLIGFLRALFILLNCLGVNQVLRSLYILAK